MKLICTRELGTLRPVDDRGRDLLSKLKLGFHYQVEIKRPRNLQQLKLYWSLIHLVFENQTRYLTEDDLSDALKIAVGHCDNLILPDGRIAPRPRSISFAKTEQDQWQAFLSAVIVLVRDTFLPTLSEGDLRRELETITGIRQ